MEVRLYVIKREGYDQQQGILFDLLSNSLNFSFKEMHGGQSGESVCGYWLSKD